MVGPMKIPKNEGVREADRSVKSVGGWVRTWPLGFWTREYLNLQY